jgi:transposase
MNNTTHTHVGIDLARRAKHKAVVLREPTSAGKAASPKSFAFAHDREGFVALRQYMLKRIDGASLDGVVVNMEPTSGVWEVVAGFLRAHGADVYFTRTDVVSQLRKVHSKFAKTDRIDAHTLATMPRSFPERLVPVADLEPRIRTLRQLSAQRHRLVEDATRWKNRLVAKLEFVWTPLLGRLKSEERFSQLLRAFFRHFTRPRDVAHLGHDRFLAWCRTHAHGNTDPDRFETLWQGALQSAQLWELLDGCQAITIDWDCLHELIVQDLRLLENLETEIATVEERIGQARADVPECNVVEQLPGVGPVVGATLASTLLPIARFASAKKCGAFTGFTSRRKSSANRDIEGLRITKSGNRRLKRDLALAADVAMKHDAELAAFAIRLLGAGKHYNKVRVAVGRKLAVRAYSLLKRYAAGQTDVTYLWRDPDDRPIDKRQSKALAHALWTTFNSQQKQNGSSPSATASWQSEDSTQRTPDELPGGDHDQLPIPNANPKRTFNTWGTSRGKPVRNGAPHSRKKHLLSP